MADQARNVALQKAKEHKQSSASVEFAKNRKPTDQNLRAKKMTMSIYPPIFAGIAYFALGGLWFTPLFGKAWDKAVGFDRPASWAPPLAYYIGPLLGCLVSAFALAALLHLANTTTLGSALLIGAIAGFGFSASVTTVNAISPNVPHPALYAAVVGGYHFCGTLLSTLIIYWLSSW